MWTTRFAFTPEDVKDALARLLINRHDIASTVRQGINAESLSLTAITGRSKERELLIGVFGIRIDRPLVNADALVGVVHIAELVVDNDGLDFAVAAECAESSHERRLHAPRTVVRQAILPEVVAFWSGLWRDDREDGAIARAPIEANSHRAALRTRRALEDMQVTRGDVAQIAAVGRNRIHAQSTPLTFCQHRDIRGDATPSCSRMMP